MATTAIIIAGVLAFLLLLIVAFIAANWAPERSLAELRGRWAPAPSLFVDVAGLNVHMRDEGPADDPTPVVLLHGTGSSLHAWDGWVEALKETRRVIRFDLPGFGLTGPSPARIYTLDNDARVVIALLDRLAIKRCVIGGNSLGGAVAWRTALAHPCRVEKLILVDAVGYPDHSISIPIGYGLAQMPALTWLLKNTLPRSLVKQGLHNIFGDPKRVTQEMIDRAVDLNQREGNRQALVERLRQRRPSALCKRIPELTVPTLILWGGRDRLIPPDDAKRFHRDIAGSTLVIFDDLGHAPEEEDPVRTVEAVKRFLDPA
ncbi:MAG TPA: alpha/beta hydrolase [Xanthobacteraceae bacterium]